MTKKVLLKILVCALLCAGATGELFAQPNAGGGAPGGGRGRGGPGGGLFGGGGGRRGGGFGQPSVVAGPPAPVPPEVAIPRPSADEVARMNDEFKKFVASVPDKANFDKYVTLQIGPRTNTCIVPTSGGVRGPRHQGFVDTAKSGDFDLLFEGDSITDFWQSSPDQQGGAEVFKKYFGDIKVANFAVAGDTTQGLLWGLQDGEGQGHKPKVIMLMIGTNNTGGGFGGGGGNTGPEIAEGVGADVLEMRKDFPDAKILLLAIFPRGTGPTDAARVKNEEANKIIAKLDDGKHVFFKNINDKFLDKDGKLIGFRNDNLHPDPSGYEIWGSTVAPILKDMLK